MLSHLLLAQSILRRGSHRAVARTVLALGAIGALSACDHLQAVLPDSLLPEATAPSASGKSTAAAGTPSSDPVTPPADEPKPSDQDAVGLLDTVTIDGLPFRNGTTLTWVVPLGGTDLGNPKTYTVTYSTDMNCDLDAVETCSDADQVVFPSVEPGALNTATFTGLKNNTWYFFWIEGERPDGQRVAGEIAQLPAPWSANGFVNAIELGVDGTTYLGGAFSAVGPTTGGGVLFQLGVDQPRKRYPVVDGSVFAGLADGQGGLYIGGDFVAVDGAPRSNVAHIRADGTVDPNFSPDVSGWVHGIERIGDTLYLAGYFVFVDGVSRVGLAAVDATTGALLDWNPGLDERALAIAKVGNTIYAGGDFQTAGGLQRKGLVAVDATTGAVLNFDAQSDGSVNALVAVGDTLYIGGSFTTMGGMQRNRAAAINTTTGSFTAWNPNVDGFLWALAASSEGSTLKIFIGGDFTSVGGTARRNLAAVDGTTGAVDTSWTLDTNDQVLALAATNGVITVGGRFTEIGGEARTRVAQVSPVVNVVTSWNPAPGGAVRALVTLVDPTPRGNDETYVGGEFRSLSTAPRANLAALDAVTGVATSWNPGTNEAVSAIKVSGDTVYVGGWFTEVGGATRHRLAAIDAATGGVTSFAANIDNQGVWEIEVANDVVFAGGKFTTVNGEQRPRLAAFDAQTGAVVSGFNPMPNGDVFALAAIGDLVYVGGEFTRIAGVARNRLAAVNATTGVATEWNPDVKATVRDPNEPQDPYFYYRDFGFERQSVSTLFVVGETVYVGGSFGNVGGQNRNNLAAVDATTGLATTWDPNVGGIVGFYGNTARVSEVVVDGDTIYVGGDLRTVGGEALGNVVAIDAASGEPTSFDAAVLGDVYAIAVSEDVVFAGGNIYSAGGQIADKLAQVSK